MSELVYHERAPAGEPEGLLILQHGRGTDEQDLLTLKAAWLMDTVGNRHARIEISAIKVAAPNVALKVIDRAIQVHGGGGVSEDFQLASSYAHLRTLRLADGPDEVHKLSIARRELAPHMPREES